LILPIKPPTGQTITTITITIMTTADHLGLPLIAEDRKLMVIAEEDRKLMVIAEEDRRLMLKSTGPISGEDVTPITIVDPLVAAARLNLKVVNGLNPQVNGLA
jgi:hypothetical protein